MTTVPNRSYLYMTAVKTSSTKGLNEEVWLEALDVQAQAKILKLAQIGSIKESFNEIKSLFESGVGIFKERRQPVNNRLKARISYHSMDEWDSIFEKYVSRGFEVQETSKMEVKKITTLASDEKYKPMEDAEVQAFIDFLRSYADQVIQKAFTISVKDVSDERMDAAKEILKKLETGYKTMSVAAFNQYRHKLHQKLPRTIANVRKDDAKNKDQFEEKLKEEIEYFNFFSDQLALARNQKKSSATETICEANNISIELVKDPAVIEHVKTLMGNERSKFSKLFRVENKTTDAFLENYVKDHNNCAVTELFHGSGTENWWSIITKGLYVNPEALGVSITGKMFGNGIYFAPEAGKSLGYTSLGGSYWKGGSDNTAYLAVFNVATGNPYYIYRDNKGIPNSYSGLQSIASGKDCLWAERHSKNSNSSLYRDEVIVYTDGSIREGKKVDPESTYSQCSIKYLIEVDLNKSSL